MGHRQSKNSSGVDTDISAKFEYPKNGSLAPFSTPFDSVPANQTEENERNFVREVIDRIKQMVPKGKSQGMNRGELYVNEKFMCEVKDPSIADTRFTSSPGTRNDSSSYNMIDNLPSMSAYNDFSHERKCDIKTTVHEPNSISKVPSHQLFDRHHFLCFVDVDSISFTPLDSSSRNRNVDECNGGSTDSFEGVLDSELVEVDLKSDTCYHSLDNDSNDNDEQPVNGSKTKKFLNKCIKRAACGYKC